MPAKTLKFKNENCLQSTLGMTWYSQNDCIQFDCSFSVEHLVKLTRWVILPVYSRIFQPLGFVQPFILQPKLIIQELCRLGLSWDDEVPAEVVKDWHKWLSGIKDIAKFSFPWCVVCHNAYKKRGNACFFGC